MNYVINERMDGMVTCYRNVKVEFTIVDANVYALFNDKHLDDLITCVNNKLSCFTWIQTVIRRTDIILHHMS